MNSTNQQEMRERLSQAIANNGLTIHYQPQIDLLTQEFTAFEVLSRWHDSDLGWIAPDQFIPLAEGDQLMVPLGRSMFQQVMSDVPALSSRYPNARIAVNFSMHELSEPDFFEWFEQSVSRNAKGNFNRFEIEVTEASFNRLHQPVRTMLLQLRRLGVRVAMDDFGTGQSSLARLHTIPFDKIKLDKLFVQQLSDPMVLAIVKSVHALCHQFGKELVAEGLETPEEQAQLLQTGCHLAQGYLISKPHPLVHWV